MSTTGISSTQSLLDSYDPTNPSSLGSALTAAGLSDSYYSLGANQVDPADSTVPVSATTVPTTAASSASTTAAASTATGLNVYQQALSSLDQWVAQTLITASVGGSSSSTSTGSSSLDSTLQATDAALESAADAQESLLLSQQQSALTAAQSALDAGQTVDTTA